MAPLRYAAKFDPFLSSDCAPTPSTLAQSKERKGSNFAIWQHWNKGVHSISDDDEEEGRDVTTPKKLTDAHSKDDTPETSPLKVAPPQGTHAMSDVRTDLPAYSDTVYSDTPLTVTLLACPKILVCRQTTFGYSDTCLQ